MLMWNFRYIFLLASCLFVFIVIVIAFYINRLCTINCLEYFNSLVLLKLILKNSIYIQQVRIKIRSKTKFLTVEIQKIIKLATLEYFILVYSWNCCNVLSGPLYAMLVNFNSCQRQGVWKKDKKVWWPYRGGGVACRRRCSNLLNTAIFIRKWINQTYTIS